MAGNVREAIRDGFWILRSVTPFYLNEIQRDCFVLRDIPLLLVRDWLWLLHSDCKREFSGCTRETTMPSFWTALHLADMVDCISSPEFAPELVFPCWEGMLGASMTKWVDLNTVSKHNSSVCVDFSCLEGNLPIHHLKGIIIVATHMRVLCL